MTKRQTILSVISIALFAISVIYLITFKSLYNYLTSEEVLNKLDEYFCATGMSYTDFLYMVYDVCFKFCFFAFIFEPIAGILAFIFVGISFIFGFGSLFRFISILLIVSSLMLLFIVIIPKLTNKLRRV